MSVPAVPSIELVGQGGHYDCMTWGGSQKPSVVYVYTGVVVESGCLVCLPTVG